MEHLSNNDGNGLSNTSEITWNEYTIKKKNNEKGIPNFWDGSKPIWNCMNLPYMTGGISPSASSVMTWGIVMVLPRKSRGNNVYSPNQINQQTCHVGITIYFMDGLFWAKSYDFNGWWRGAPLCQEPPMSLLLQNLGMQPSWGEDQGEFPPAVQHQGQVAEAFSGP